MGRDGDSSSTAAADLFSHNAKMGRDGDSSSTAAATAAATSG